MTLDELLEVGTAELKEATITATEQLDLQPHTFSPRFERRMGRLLRRAKHPILNRAARWAACVALSLLLAGGAVLAVVPDARAAVKQWFVDTFGRGLLFHIEAVESVIQTDRSFVLTALPEEYSEMDRFGSPTDGYYSVIYANQRGHILHFRWYWGQYDLDSYLVSSYESGNLERLDTFVKTDPAVFLFEATEETSNTLIWYDSEREVFFEIRAYGNLDALLEMAESIEEK